MSKSDIQTDPQISLVLKGHRKAVTDVAFNQNESLQFATSSEDHSLVLWNSQQNGRSYNYLGHTNGVTALEWSPNGQILASTSLDTTVRFWVPTIKGDCKEFKAHLAPVLTLDFSPDSTKLLTGAKDKAVKLWDVATRRFISSFAEHNHWVRCAKFFLDGRLIASCADDRTVRIWDTRNGQCVHIFTGVEGSPSSIAVHKNDNSIAAAMNSGSIRIYEIKSKKLQQHYMLHNSSTSVSWHPLANYLLTAGADGKIHIVDVMEGRPIYTVLGHEGKVNCAKFSPDGECFVSGGENKVVLVWKTNFLNDI